MLRKCVLLTLLPLNIKNISFNNEEIHSSDGVCKEQLSIDFFLLFSPFSCVLILSHFLDIKFYFCASKTQAANFLFFPPRHLTRSVFLLTRFNHMHGNLIIFLMFRGWGAGNNCRNNFMERIIKISVKSWIWINFFFVEFSNLNSKWPLNCKLK